MEGDIFGGWSPLAILSSMNTYCCKDFIHYNGDMDSNCSPMKK
jgi:hypothetical protein